MQDWLFFIAGALLSLAGIWLAFHFRPGRRLNIAFASVELTHSSMSSNPELSIEFKGQKVTSVYRHNLYVWNSGNTSIISSDVPPDGRLGAKLSEKALVGVGGLLKVGDTFSLTFRELPGKVEINLDYLDVGQGFVVEIYEAIIDPKLVRSPAFEGHLLASRGIRSGIQPISARELVRSYLFFAAVATLIAIAVIVTITLTYFGSESTKNAGPALSAITGLSVILVLNFSRLFRDIVQAWRFRVPSFPNLSK